MKKGRIQRIDISKPLAWGPSKVVDTFPVAKTNHEKINQIISIIYKYYLLGYYEIIIEV